MDGGLYHLLILESSGILTVAGDITGDVWMCGGGASGSMYAGGSGGFTANFFHVPVVSAAVAIGAGGYPSADTTFNNRGGFAGGTTAYPGVGSANGGERGTQISPYQAGAGGCGGGGYGQENYASAGGAGQGTTTRPFASPDMPPQCGGGGGRTSAPGTWNATVLCYLGGNGGSDGGNGTDAGPGLTAARNVANNCSNGGAGGGGGGSIRGYISQYTSDGGDFGGDSGAVRCGYFVQPNAGRGGGFGYGGGGGGAEYGATGQVGSGVGTPGAVMIRIPV